MAINQSMLPKMGKQGLLPLVFTVPVYYGSPARNQLSVVLPCTVQNRPSATVLVYCSKLKINKALSHPKQSAHLLLFVCFQIKYLQT